MPVIVNSQPQLGKTTEYRLSIQADLNGFSFSVTDPKLNQLLYLYGSDFTMDTQDMELFSRNVSGVFKNEPLLRAKYQSVQITYGTQKFVTIPKSIHKQEDDLGNLTRMHVVEELEEIHSYDVPQEEMVIIFPVNSTFLNVVKSYQNQFDLFPAIGTYIKYIVQFQDYNKLFFQYFKGAVIIIAAEGERIVFCNSYPAHHFNSALYFALVVMKEVQFNPEQTTIYISGNIRQLETHDIAKYFSKVKYFRNPQMPLPDSGAELKYSTLMFNHQ